MGDIYSQIRTQLAGVWRRRWYVVAVAWLISGAGWTMVASLPDRYESSARVYVDMDTMLGPLMRGLAVEMNLFQQIDLMQRTLYSRPNLEKIILMTDLDYRVHTPEQKEALVRSLEAKLELKQQGRNLFKVGYMDTDPTLARRVVQSVLQIFVEGNLGASRLDMDVTRRFLEAQIGEYEQKLNASEERLATFKRENMGRLPGDGNYHTYVRALRTAVEQARDSLDEARDVQKVLQKELAETPKVIEVADESAVAMTAGELGGPESATQIRMFELQNLIDALKMRYTDKHPDVARAKSQLADLQKRFEAQQEMGMDGPGSEPAAVAPPPRNTSPNPLFEQLKLKLVTQDADVAALERRLEQKRAELEKWEQVAQTVPQVEAEMSRLTRDYQIVKKGYEELRARQESARLARDLETGGQKVQFRIIDPPDLPLTPSGPNRPLFLSVVLAGAIAAGLAFAFLLSQINSGFSSVSNLRSTFALPVLGAITAVTSTQERRRRIRELITFGFVCAGLLSAFGGLLVVELLIKA